MQAPSAHPIPALWQQCEPLRPLLDRYGPRVLGKALARFTDLDHSRTGCHQIAALIMALTDFQEWFDYADFYISFGSDDPAVATCLEELQALHLRSTKDEDRL